MSSAPITGQRYLHAERERLASSAEPLPAHASVRAKMSKRSSSAEVPAFTSLTTVPSDRSVSDGLVAISEVDANEGPRRIASRNDAKISGTMATPSPRAGKPPAPSRSKPDSAEDICTCSLSMFSLSMFGTKPKVVSEAELLIAAQKECLVTIADRIAFIEQNAAETKQRAVHRASVTNTWTAKASLRQFRNVRVDSEGVMCEIDLTNQRIQMSIDELRPCLTNRLVRLALQHNDDCHGNIADLAGCNALQVLLLCNTSITGNIAALAGCGALRILDLQSSKLEGDIAVCMHLRELRTLCLNSNDSISGDITHLSSCALLEDFSAVDCPAIYGDCDVFSRTPNMHRLNVKGSQITGVEMFADLVF